MKVLSDKELMNVDGGASFSATLLNAVSRAISTIQELGRNLGSAIRRLYNGSFCSL